MGFKRYTVNDVNQNRFYQMPKFLFDGEMKSKLSSEAKVLYSLLRDRHELSLANNWVNEKGEVYFFFKREEMCEMLGCQQGKLRKLIKQLTELNLFEEERQGLSKPNFIYLNYLDQMTTTYTKKAITPENENFCDDEEAQTDDVIDENVLKNHLQPSVHADCRKSTVKSVENQQSRVSKIDSQECRKSTPNDTNNNNTNNKNTYKKNTEISYLYHIKAQTTKKGNYEKNTIDEKMRERELYSEVLQENLDFCDYEEAAIESGKNSEANEFFEFLKLCYDIMLDNICASTDTIRIGKNDKPKEVVKSRLLKIKAGSVEYVYDCVSSSNNKIGNIQNYLLTTLYNSVYSENLYYSNRVRSDMAKKGAVLP